MLKIGITEDKANEIRDRESAQMMHDVENLLKQNPEEINKQDEGGTSLLHIACGKGRRDLIVASLHGRHKILTSLLEIGYLSVALVLLDKRANPNIQDGEGWTPLHVAAYWDQRLLFEPLLTFGADMELVNRDNETPLDVTDDPDTREKLEGQSCHPFSSLWMSAPTKVFPFAESIELREKFKKKSGLSRSSSNSSAFRRGLKIGKLNMKRQNEEDEFPKSPTRD